MTFGRQWDRDRIASAIGVAALHALFGYAFIAGLGMKLPERASDRLKLFEVLPEPPPPPPVEKPRPREARAPKREGAASPSNLKAVASPVVAPVPVVTLPVPPPVIAAPVPRLGNETSAGAAPVPGPGTGSGGVGNGSGSGGSGDGPGGGGGGTPLRWLSGKIKDSDYPRSALEAGASGTVYLRFTVGVKGRVTDCAVTRSSGNAALDEATCRLIVQRFHYLPKRDAEGRPMPTVVTGEHEWWLARREDAEVQVRENPQ